MKKAIWFVLALSLLAGCAWFRQAQEDVSLSKATPYAAGEVSSQERASNVARSLSSLPYGAGVVAVPLATFVIAWWLDRRRGRRIRLASAGASSTPVTGELGKATGFEKLLQVFSGATAAIFEVGKDGSPFKRGWKAFLYTLIGSSTFGAAIYPHLIDLAKNFSDHPPAWLPASLATAAGAGIVGFLEKQVAKFKVTSPATPASTPV